MSSNLLHIDLPPHERPSLVPWLIAIVCACLLLVMTVKLARSIPTTLQSQAVQLLDASVFPDISVQANGRDLELSGTVTIDQSPALLAQRLEQIPGVNRVRDSLTVIDPTVETAARREQFVLALAGIDVSQVAFQPGSISFTTESDDALAQLLSLLRQHPDGRVRIEGHTDNTGPDAVNLRVSRDRAAAVANYLMARGIPADQLVVTGYGSTQPIADNTTDQGRTQNRRIEINPVL